MIKHLMTFHIDELSDTGFTNYIKYLVKKGIIDKEQLPDFGDKEFRVAVTQTFQGRLLLSLADVLEFVDQRVPEGPYNIRRNIARSAWQFDHDAVTINTSQPAELISSLWNIAKTFFEKGTGIN